MTLDGVVYPEPFRLGNRNFHGVTPSEQVRLISKFQLAVFESSKRAGLGLKPLRIPSGTKVLRNVNDRSSILDARKVPPGASTSTKVRWSGHIADTNICRGALFTSQDTKGFLNAQRNPMDWKQNRNREIHGFWPFFEGHRQLLVGQIYYTFTLEHAISVVDLSPITSPNFYAQIESDQVYQAAKRDLRVQPELSRLVFGDPLDYTASRPVGLSVLLALRVEGIRVISAQSEVPELPGCEHNLVLSGDHGKEIAYLRPTGKLIAGVSNHRSALIEIDADGMPPESAIIVPGSLLKTATD